ncbi:M48 family metallopeptidase [Ruminococcaceae bacterium OttesenSCG-928-A16]|nr:M48 family metallopeptidase [Ruminococcaceae bacterium OttesenSCG-928-A16]
MEEIVTSQGRLTYTLTRKKVRNLNLRIKPNGQLMVSAPLRMPLRDIEGFIREKAGWIVKNQAKMASQPPPVPARYTKAECLELFTVISDRIFPLFAGLLGGQKPTLKVREMTSRWGVCHTTKRTIVLNTRLAEKPTAAIEYVILHEYVHFLHPNHQEGFHAEMARLMPDYKERRKLLRG